MRNLLCIAALSVCIFCLIGCSPEKGEVEILQEAAEQGDTEAQAKLGRAYYYGEGVPQDYKEAAKWYRKAAEQGVDATMVALGALYLQGEGVPQDYVQAHMWSNLAASQLKGEGREHGVKLRDEAAKAMTREQIAEAQRLAQEWAEKHRKQVPPKRRTL